MLRELSDGVLLLHHHVDGLEVSCTVDQVPMLLSGRPDRLEPTLAELKKEALGLSPPRPVPTGWLWTAEGETQPVVLLPTALRPRYRYCLESSAWRLFVAAGRAVVPRIAVQLRADYLLRVGPLNGYNATRTWVERDLVPLIGGRPDDDPPVWRISRIDLAADLVGVAFEGTDLERFTTRARERRGWHEDAGR